MRTLSRKLSISRTAAYHHFANKDELLAAVGQDGFRRLAQHLQEAANGQSSAILQLRASLCAYVEFAVEETEFFRLMFANVLERPVVQSGNSETLEEYPFSSPEALSAFDLLVSTVKRCQLDGEIAAGDPLMAANALHAFAHGIAHLAVDKNLKVPGSIRTFTEFGIDCLLVGLRTAQPSQQRNRKTSK
jgi:AcrR family transcriptional regulator